MMYTYRVGEPYNPGRLSWPEHIEYNFRGGQHELLAFMDRPTAAEIGAWKRGKVELALFTRGPLVVLLYRITQPGLAHPVFDWSDCPYSWHLVPEKERSLPEDPAEPTRGAALTMILAGAGRGIIQAIRVVGMGHAFTLALHQAIREQAGQIWDSAAYDAALDRLYTEYPSDSEIVQAAQVTYTAGTHGV